MTTYSGKELLHPLWLKCRQIASTISPFLNIFRVFYAGAGIENEDEDSEGKECMIMLTFTSIC